MRIKTRRLNDMNGETLYTATDYFRPFPDPGDVFANRVDEHSRYLILAATLSLRHLSHDWQGDIHFILPIEPVGGYGLSSEESTAYHNYLCRPNCLGYYLRGNKCELACDFRIFHQAYYSQQPPNTKLREDEAAQWASHCADTRRQFMACAAHFRKHGWLCAHPEEWNRANGDPDDYQASLVRNLGGKSFHGNWSNTQDFPMSRYPDQFEDRGTTYNCDRVLPQTEDGRDFNYIGEMEMWNYIGDTNGVLLLFYDPQQEIALTTIDWT